MKSLLLTAMMAVGLAGCGKNGAAVAHETAAAPSVELKKPEHIASNEEWDEALKAAYFEADNKDEGDGIQSFTAWFGGKPKHGGVPMMSKRDAFRHLRFFTPIYSDIASRINRNTVRLYISLPDYEKPLIFIAPFYHGDSWLFMNKIAVMADGNIALEKDLSNYKPNHDVENGSVSERIDFIANQNEIDELRKISNAKSIMVRLSGEKGYLTIRKEEVKWFLNDIKDLLTSYDLLNKNLTDHTPPAKTTSK